MSATETLYPIMLLYYESFWLSSLAGHPGLATNTSPSSSHEVTRLFFSKNGLPRTAYRNVIQTVSKQFHSFDEVMR